MKVERIVVGAIKTNCYLAINGAELAVIDPGDDAGIILDKIKEIKARPRYIINTHYHWDHTLANEAIKKAASAEILIHREEAGRINFSVDRFLSDSDLIEVGNTKLKAVHTPGHSRGSICLFWEDIVFTGDTLFKDGYGRTDLPTGSDKDMRASLIKLSKRIKPGMTVYPGHGEPFRYYSGMIESITLPKAS